MKRMTLFVMALAVVLGLAQCKKDQPTPETQGVTITLDLEDNNDNGAKVQSYPGSGNECERWHLRYKGDGWYVITNYDSGLSLEGSSNNTDATIPWQQG